MKRFLFLLAFGLAAADKLDRTYLPPPGSQYAGGHPGDLQVPLVYPKESYTTTSPFTSGQINDGSVTIGDGQIVPGATSVPGTVNSENSKDLVPVTPTNRSPFTNFQNSYKVPTTTTSYAFTQTTTFPTTDGFETIPSPIGPGFPIDGSLNQLPGFVNQTLVNGQIFNQNSGQFQPGLTQTGNQIIQGPIQGPSIPGVQNPLPGNQIISGHPGYPQHINQYQQSLPGPTISPLSGTSFQPGLVTIPNQGNQHQGVQLPQQFVPQGIIPSTTATPGYQYNVPSQNIQGTGITGQQQPISPTTSPQQSQTQFIDKYGNIQGTIPGYTTSQPDQQYGGDLNSIPGTSGPFAQQGAQQIVNGFVPGQQQDISGQKAINPLEQYQLANLPGLTGNIQQGQNQFGGLQPYLPDQSNQRPQYQQTFPSGIPQGTTTSIVSGDQTQQPQFGGQQTNYPTTIIPQGFISDTITQQQIGGQQPQFIGQQPFPSRLTPQGQVIDQGSQPTGQQNVFPSTEIPQPSTTFGQTGSTFGGNQPQVTGQSFPTLSNGQPEFYRPGENLINVNGSNISGYNAIPNDGRIYSRPSVSQTSPDQNLVTDAPQNIYGTSTTRPISSLPSNYQQPSTFASYGTTPGSIYSSSSPSYPGAKLPAIPSINARPLPVRPQAESDRNAVILNYENVLTPEGYAYNFDTSNGIHADENGTTVDGTKANGSYSYIGDDGKLYRVEYSADENGFRPHGDHLPTPPPIPEAIQRVIEQANKDKEAGISHDGFYDEAKYGHKKYKGHKHRQPEKQDQIRNGADIPDDYKNGEDNVKMPGRKGERKPVTSTNNNYPSEYDDTGYDSEDDISDKDMTIRNQPSRTSSFKRPNHIKPESGESENEQDKDLVTTIEDQALGHPTRQQIKHRKQFSQDSRRPYSPSRNGKPLSSNVKNNNEETYDGEEIVEDNKEFRKEPNQVFYENDSQVPSKPAEKNIEGSSRQMKLPGRFSYKDKTDTEVVKGDRRPGSSNSQQQVSSYEREKAKSKDKISIKPSKEPSKTFSGNYYITDESSEDQEDYETPILSDEDYFVGKGPQKMGSKTNKYESTRKQRPGADLQKTYNNVKGSRFEPKGQPSNDQSSKDSESKYSEQSDDEERGYQYIPPQNKLGQEEINRFPSRFNDKVTKKLPVTKYVEDKKTTAQPFITPNVHRDEDDTYDDVSEENISPKKFVKLPSKGTATGNFITSTTPEYEYESTDISSEYSDEQKEMEQDKTNKPGKVGSTRLPEYPPQDTTEKTKFDEYTTDDEELVPQRVFKMPNQKNHERYPQDSNKEVPQGRPGQKTGASRKPTYSYISSTTPMPFRKSNRPGFKRPQQKTEQVQSTTTYEPTDISSNEDEYTQYTTKPTNYTSKPNGRRPISKPIVKDDSDTIKVTFSRPTSQPTFDYTDDGEVSGSPTIRPGIVESAFGKPSTRPTTSKVHTYATGRPITKVNRPGSSVPNRPGTTAGGFYEKAKPGYKTFSSTTETSDILTSGPVTGRPDASQYFGQPGRKFLPSTTYRPNYSITDISEPGSVTVDAFGRPLQPVSGNRQLVSQSGLPGTTPNYPVSANQGTSSGLKNIYQDSRVTIPGQQGSRFNSFKPTSEPRFGGPVQVTPGTKPAEFGPSSVTTPGYLSPYGYPTEKVIGEDFSGPKQPQKFDPETGYYY